MRRVGFGIAALASFLALSSGATAEAAVKRYCCYRVDVKANPQIHARWDNGGEPGGSNGTYDMNVTWNVRELVEFHASRFGRVQDLRWIEGRDDRAIKAAWSKFSGREQSNQSRNDATGVPVAYPPCDFTHQESWGRTADPGVIPSVQIFVQGQWSSLVTHEQTGAYGPFWIDRSGCNNNVPFYGPDGGFTVESFNAPSHYTQWDAFGFNQIHARHTVPQFNGLKLKKLKDYEVTLDRFIELPQPGETDDPRFDHTGTSTVTATVTFTHFHRDRLQAQINAGNDLTRN